MFKSFRRRVAVATIQLVVLGLSSGAIAAEPARDTPDVQQSIRELQQRQDEIIEQLTSEKREVKTFLNDQLTFGGFFDSAALTGLWGPTTPAEVSSSSHSLALNLAAEISDQFRFNSQLLFTAAFPLENPNNNPNAPSVGLPSSRQFGVFSISPAVSQAYVEYSTDPSIAVQVGRGFVPFGIAFQQRDLVLFRRRGGPQMLNPNTAGTVGLLSGTWSGIHVTGSFRLGSEENRWGYDYYSLTPGSNPNTMGGGARAWIDTSKYLLIGVSSQVAKRGGFTYEALGSDAKIKCDRFGVDAEYLINLSPGEGGNPASYYAEPYYTFFSEKFLIYAAIDFINNPFGVLAGASNSIPDPYQRWEFGGGVNWMPIHETRFRLGILFNDYTSVQNSVSGSDRDYFSLDLSAGVEF